MLATNATLMIVDVSGNPLGDEGVRSLAKAAALHPTLTPGPWERGPVGSSMVGPEDGGPRAPAPPPPRKMTFHKA